MQIYKPGAIHSPDGVSSGGSSGRRKLLSASTSLVRRSADDQQSDTECDQAAGHQKLGPHLDDSTAADPLLQLWSAGILLSPATLTQAGIPVTHAVQHPGQYLVLMPGTYHMYFDQGLNCVESVCVAPPDWLREGRRAIISYQLLHRPPVCAFSVAGLSVCHSSGSIQCL
jgi:hypothetical protein